MIIVQLMGGLGNQMFQYAFARNLALQNNTELVLDIGFFESSKSNPNTTKREYALGAFPKLIGRIATTDDLHRFETNAHQNTKSLISMLRSKLNPYRKIVERQFHFDNELLELKGNLYLNGYWQSENYFKEIRHSLLNVYYPAIVHQEVFEVIFNEVNNSNSVSLHIRRGDYVSNAKTSAWHGVLSLEYYQQAIRRIKKTDKQSRYFVFSDEPQWVEENMNLPNDTYLVSGKGLSPVEEMNLMSQCKHNIIANSSFSWWGAWLNQNEGRQVIAPKSWFLDTSQDTSDLCPTDWIRL